MIPKNVIHQVNRGVKKNWIWRNEGLKISWTFKILSLDGLVNLKEFTLAACDAILSVIY